METRFNKKRKERKMIISFFFMSIFFLAGNEVLAVDPNIGTVSTNARAVSASPTNPGFDPCIDVATLCTGLLSEANLGTSGLQTDAGTVQGNFRTPQAGALTDSMFGEIRTADPATNAANQGGRGSWWNTWSQWKLGGGSANVEAPTIFQIPTALDVLTDGTAVVNPLGSGGAPVGIAGVNFNVTPTYEVKAGDDNMNQTVAQTTFVGGLSGTSAEPIGGASNPGNEVQAVSFNFNMAEVPDSTSTGQNFNANNLNNLTVTEEITQGDAFHLKRTGVGFGWNGQSMLRGTLPTGESQSTGDVNCNPKGSVAEPAAGTSNNCWTLP